MNALSSNLSSATSDIVRSVLGTPSLAHLSRVGLPSKDAAVRILEILREIVFPGFFGKRELTQDTLPHHLTAVAAELSETLYEQVRACLRYRNNLCNEQQQGGACEAIDAEAAGIVAEFLARIPAVRELLATDVAAAYDADPAAQNTDETILSYPGLIAITFQRFAHELHNRRVPMLPRMLTEHGHSLTGIDIHPGAKIGRRFFIDHGTGVVIGETVVLGDNVKIYQGVTLGGLSPDRLVEHYRGGIKRHPTIEDDVTLYANATILGGDTTIGRGSVIGGNVFLTTTVPPDTLVSLEAPKLQYRQRRSSKNRRGAEVEVSDFQI